MKEMANQNVMGPGIYPDVPFAEYLAWPYLSQSILKEGRSSMAHLWAALSGERFKEPTDEMVLGSALHCAFLEPQELDKRVVIWFGARRYGKVWDEFQLEHAGKIILTQGNYLALDEMLNALRRHPVVQHWSRTIKWTEVSALGDVAGVLMKGRCDALTPEPLVDLKKVASADPRLITKTILNFGYHIQAYIYRKLFDRDRFLLICVESSPPYDVVAYELSPGFLRQGEREALQLLERYQECMESGAWPGRSDEVVTLEPPEWFGETADSE